MLSLLACQRDVIDSSSSSIINGSQATVGQHPWTVAVLNIDRSGTGGLCSGTLISDYAILTAKHCVYQDSGGSSWTPVAASNLRVIVGHDLNRADGITDNTVAYEVRTTSGGWSDRDIGDGRDIAVVLLPRKLAGNIEPRQFATTPPSPGTQGLIVGFGINDEITEESGTKYWGMTTIEAVGSVELRAGGASWTCQGDSGGPLMVGDTVVGVTSWGLGGCDRFSQHFYTLVSAHRALIQDAVSFEPPCEPENEGCDGEDNDCDDLVDEGCTALGEVCVADNECFNGSCSDVSAGRVCTRDCDPRSTIPMCPFGFKCEEVGCGVGLCVAGDPGSLTDGEPCGAASDCASNRCTLVQGAMRCGRQCDVADDACVDTVCEDTGTGCGTCIPFELSTAPRPFGAPCSDGSLCQSGNCLAEGGGEGFCSSACSEAAPCPDSYHCRDAICRAGDLAAPGGGCVTSEDCGLGSECANVDGDQLCALGCEEGCEDGFQCAMTSLGMRCVAQGLALGEGCLENEECRTGICAGTCTRICDDTPCPGGFECRPAGPVSGCFPPDESGDGGGGCAAIGSREAPLSPGLVMLIAALVGLVARRGRLRR